MTNWEQFPIPDNYCLQQFSFLLVLIPLPWLLFTCFLLVFRLNALSKMSSLLIFDYAAGYYWYGHCYHPFSRHFTPCFLWNSPSARFILCTQYIPLTQMYHLSINLNLCHCHQKLLSQPLQSTLPCRKGSIQIRFMRSLRARSGTPPRKVTCF